MVSSTWTSDFLMAALCAVTLAVALFSSPTDCRLWQENAKAKMEINNEEYRRTAVQFSGNGSIPDYFRILELDGQWLLVGARNAIYNISLPSLQENQRIEWTSSDDTIKTCREKGKNHEECQNYLRLLHRTSRNDFRVCGTNAYKPSCRDFAFNPLDGAYVPKKDTDGVTFCPYDPRHNSTAIFVGGHLYAATVADFAAQDSLIRRAMTRTGIDKMFLSEANFVGSLALGDYVYFFLRENALEFSNCGKTTYSRVARVCKNDAGGGNRRILQNNWTTFLKSRLNCSMPGDYPFQFDEIQSISDLTEGSYNGQQSQVVYGVFSTPVNSLAGSAVCVFSFADMDRTFGGRFKEQKSPLASWTPVSDADVPEPRPGQCVNDSTTLPDQVLTFANKHPLMQEPVAPLYGRPVLVFTSLASRYTAIAVAPQVKTLDDRYYDVIYVGTDDGRIIKSLNLDLDTKDQEEPVVIEEIEVFRDSREPVTSLKVVGNQLIAVFKNSIHALPLERCDLKKSCRDCVALRDPHCAWMNNQCQFQDPSSSNVVWPKNGHGPVQNVRSGRDDRCPSAEATVYPPQSNYACRPCITQCPACLANSDSPGRLTGEHHANALPAAIGSDLKHTRQKTEDNEVPEYQTSNVELGHVYREETLAVAVVLTLIFSLMVGFAIGYLVSRYRHSSFKESSLSEGSDYSYTHRPGVDSRPTDYRTEPIYAPPEFAPTKAINVVLNMQRNPLKSLGATLDSKPIALSKKVYL